MKKIATSSLLILLTILSYAQPVLQTSNLPTDKVFNLYQLTNFSVANLSPSGADAEWDLSGATYTLIGTVKSVSVASTPYAATYPDANYAYKIEAGALTLYHLFKVSANGFEEVATDLGGSSSQYFTDYRTVLPASFSFNGTVNDTYQKGGQSSNTSVITYDSYGTFKTNDATYTNVARTMRTTSASNTGVWWWHPTEMYPILNGDGANFTVWKPTTATTVNDIVDNNSVLIYPNPATNILTIINREVISNLEVYNVSGQLQFTTIQSTIDISNLSAGVYFIKAYSTSGTTIIKFIKQ